MEMSARRDKAVCLAPPRRNAGAANRTRTCDPVITNDVLYQLSYCGGPSGAFGTGPKTLAPDIGQSPILQGKRAPARATALFFDAFSSREPVPTSLENALLTRP